MSVSPDVRSIARIALAAMTVATLLVAGTGGAAAATTADFDGGDADGSLSTGGDLVLEEDNGCGWDLACHIAVAIVETDNQL
jgi:cytochrome oxidase Cu insertion factor (SCO1/SenC/PrrC family)